jgi:hypothetical protein
VIRGCVGYQTDPVVVACEHPSVLAAATEQLGPASRPLIRVGWPSTAERQLITRLVADEAKPASIALAREAQLARGIGMAFTIQQWYPSAWHADLRWNWTW